VVAGRPAAPVTTWRLAGGITAAVTSRVDGDMAAGSEGSDRRRRAVIDLPWSVPRQVHGDGVVIVDEAGAGNQCEADALVTVLAGLAIGVVTADCAPVALASPEGVAGVAHAGWRGLEAGIIQATVGAMRRLGATDVTAVLGPCIHAECYEFGAADLDRLAARLGPAVRGRHGGGGPALDVPASVAAALADSGAGLVADAGICTACSDQHWSWRARSDRPRQAMVVWRR
jgi:YfiH family protein